VKQEKKLIREKLN